MKQEEQDLAREAESQKRTDRIGGGRCEFERMLGCGEEQKARNPALNKRQAESDVQKRDNLEMGDEQKENQNGKHHGAASRKEHPSIADMLTRQ